MFLDCCHKGENNSKSDEDVDHGKNLTKGCVGSEVAVADSGECDDTCVEGIQPAPAFDFVIEKHAGSKEGDDESKENSEFGVTKTATN